ncbi:hypothetical protein JWR97_03315 [Pseudomonas cedrina subsp. fulgida]|nr:hypothetical protein [Pseudomonas cedrina subsp. fulgida]
MDAQALQALLDSLIECWENEVVEFKRAGNDYSTNATRKDIDQLLSNKLSDALDDAQKETKIGRLLTSLRRAERIKNDGSREAPVWVLAE